MCLRRAPGQVHLPQDLARIGRTASLRRASPKGEDQACSAWGIHLRAHQPLPFVKCLSPNWAQIIKGICLLLLLTNRTRDLVAGLCRAILICIFYIGMSEKQCVSVIFASILSRTCLDVVEHLSSCAMLYFSVSLLIAQKMFYIFL